MPTLRMTFVLRLASASIAALALAQVSAQTTADNARFLSDLMVKAQFEQSLQVARKQMPQVTSQMMKQVTASADPAVAAERAKMVERLQPLQDKMLDRLVAELAKPEIRNQLGDAVFASITRVYDAAEIDSMADYYRTPIGAAVIAKQGAMMSDMLPATTGIMMKAMQPAMAEFMESVKKLATETSNAQAK